MTWASSKTRVTLWTLLFGPVYLDPSIWTRLFEPVYLDPSIWTRLFGPVYLDPSIWTSLFRPAYFDPSIWTRLFRPVYLDPFIWTRSCSGLVWSYLVLSRTGTGTGRSGGAWRISASRRPYNRPNNHPKIEPSRFLFLDWEVRLKSGVWQYSAFQIFQSMIFFFSFDSIWSLAIRMA